MLPRFNHQACNTKQWVRGEGARASPLHTPHSSATFLELLKVYDRELQHKVAVGVWRVWVRATSHPTLWNPASWQAKSHWGFHRGRARCHLHKTLNLIQ